jgi:hypothetical protein
LQLPETKENHHMKTFQIVLLLAGVTFATAALAQETTASPSAQQSPQTAATIASAIDREITIVEKEVVVSSTNQ